MLGGLELINDGASEGKKVHFPFLFHSSSPASFIEIDVYC